MATKKSTELATKDATPFDLAARPDFIKAGDTRGTENITGADIKPPALRLAQSNSRTVKRAEADYIEGLKEGDFYNSLTKQIYGEELRLLIVKNLGHRNIEFEPGGGGNIIDYDVPDGDPRTNFTTEVVDGKSQRVRPKASKFYDYLVLVLHDDREPELMQMSLKGTQLKKAVQLNTLLMGMKMPTFAVVFKVTTTNENGKGNSWVGWKFDMAGWALEAEYKIADAAYEAMKDKTIELETEGDDPGDAADTVAPAGDKIPF